MSGEAVFLVDNGSLEPAAVLSLRRIARKLGEQVGVRVAPVSVRHSNKIPLENLGGRPAETIEEAISVRADKGEGRFRLIPMFFGPSAALTEFLPRVVRRVGESHPGLSVEVCPPLHQPGDDRLARIIAGHIHSTARRLPAATGRRPVALVDHGSPVPAVTEVRDLLAAEVGRILGEAFIVGPCSMERREGAQFDFNEPLLEALLAREPWNRGDVIVGMQFLQPGRHAGPGGDVAEICARAREASEGLRTHMTALVGESPHLIAILADRAAAGGTVI